MTARSKTPLLKSEIPGMKPRRGKVRDVYDFGDRLLFIATDRISAFDWVLQTGIPDKGRVLTQLSEFWFKRLKVLNHLLSMNPADVPLPKGTDVAALEGRSMVVRKTSVFPVECVVRGYLSGSGWKEYKSTQAVCGVKLPGGLVESQKLSHPIFTPATKAESGHDENITFQQMSTIVGADRADQLRHFSQSVYTLAADFAKTRGIIIADTKFEFGLLNNQIYLIDEVLTPDSSRFWPADQYKAGGPQPSYDKQYVRDWLVKSSWDRNSPPPLLPPEVVEQTRSKYIEAYEQLTRTSFAWK